jgi:hypothetical protein
MARLLGIVLGALLLAGCGQSPADVLAAVEESGVECIRHLASDDDVAACVIEPEPGRMERIAVVLSDDPDVFIAVSMDAGDEGPWVVGDGWVLYLPDRGVAESVAGALGATFATSWEDVAD